MNASCGLRGGQHHGPTRQSAHLSLLLSVDLTLPLLDCSAAIGSVSQTVPEFHMRFSYLFLNWHPGLCVLSQATSASPAMLKKMWFHGLWHLLVLCYFFGHMSIFKNFTICKGYLCYAFVLRDHTMNKIKALVFHRIAISFFLR